MNSACEPHPVESVNGLKPWDRDTNSVRMYPDDPMRELRRLRRRASNLAIAGCGTFGRADIAMMVEVERELGKKLKRLAFLEKTLGDMKS